jgi:uncharacterized protein
MPVEQKIHKLEMEMELVNAMRQGLTLMNTIGRPIVRDIELLQYRIQDVLRPDSIYLFGSQASETATKESDIDLLVVMDSDLPPRKRNMLVKRLFPHRSFSLDAFVYTPQEFQRYKNVPGTIAYQAAHHGRLLYG